MGHFKHELAFKCKNNNAYHRKLMNSLISATEFKVFFSEHEVVFCCKLNINIIFV